FRFPLATPCCPVAVARLRSRTSGSVLRQASSVGSWKSGKRLPGLDLFLDRGCLLQHGGMVALFGHRRLLLLLLLLLLSVFLGRMSQRAVALGHEVGAEVGLYSRQEGEFHRVEGV